MAPLNVLVVDDESVIRLTLSLIIRKLGSEVFTVENGAKAEEYYQNNWQDIDLVILDQNMPDTTGTELFAKLKGINPDIRAVLCSGFIDDAEGFLNCGISKVCNKPLSMLDVKSLLEL